MQIAREKAEQYASAAGLRVSATKTIADVGLLGNGHTYDDTIGSSLAARRSAARSKVTDADVADGYNFTPEDVLIDASIEAVFLAE